MIAYEPGTSLVHRLDPRAKLLVQGCFAIVAYLRADLVSLGILTAVAIGILLAGGLPPVDVLKRLRYLILLLALAPVLATIQPGAPWLDVSHAGEPLRAGYRVLLIVSIGLVYVRTTPLRESQAAIRWCIPGKPGRLLAIGVGIVGRFVPLLRADVRRVRKAMRMRLAERRRSSERFRMFSLLVLVRSLRRADHLGDAMRVRCLSWNPTRPTIRFSRVDAVPFVLAVGLVTWMISGI